uniref:Uncharacterized protein n=1 Tax=Rhizophora mucronata TaxID=61149 RepID=A0A2P2QB30_RHIMU
MPLLYTQQHIFQPISRIHSQSYSYRNNSSLVVLKLDHLSKQTITPTPPNLLLEPSCSAFSLPNRQIILHKPDAGHAKTT